MRIFREGRRRNQPEADTPAVVGSIPMSEKLGVDDGLLEGGVPTNNKPDREPVGPADQPNRPGRPRINPPWPTPPENDEREYYPSNPPSSYAFSYSMKKNIAQGMMDLALLTANASQLRYIMRSPYWDLYHRINLALISLSIALQIIAGIMLIFIGRYDFKKKEERRIPQILSDVVVLVIFVITVVNIFIAAFGVDDERTTFLRWKEETAGTKEPLFMQTEGGGVRPPLLSPPNL